MQDVGAQGDGKSETLFSLIYELGVGVGRYGRIVDRLEKLDRDRRDNERHMNAVSWYRLVEDDDAELGG